jgi:hypothetical protein
MEILKLGNIEIGGKIEVGEISVNLLEIGGQRVYECQMFLDVNMIWNEEIEINHLSKLRWRLRDNEVEQLKKKGLIKIKMVVETDSPTKG